MLLATELDFALPRYENFPFDFCIKLW